MAGLAAAGTARAMGAIVRGFDTRLVFTVVVLNHSPENYIRTETRVCTAS